MNKLNHFFTTKLEKYLPKESQNTKGFFLFNPPTGSGKTTSTISYVANLLNSKSKLKIFFITNLKENLDKPFADLEKKVDSKQRILRLLSVEDELCRLSDKELWEEPKSHKFLSYSSFKEAVETYAKQKKKENFVFLKVQYLLLHM
jgi:CRISPR/Cas system-associated endonuclease/helicase Cas3